MAATFLGLFSELLLNYHWFRPSKKNNWRKISPQQFYIFLLKVLVTAFGTVFGCSIKLVVPPAIAALDSLSISPLCKTWFTKMQLDHQ
jgi:hypothetical protein